MDRTVRFNTVLAMLVVIASCERSANVPSKDTTPPVTSPPESAVATVIPAARWDSTAGPALFVMGPTPQDAFIIPSQFVEGVSLDTLRVDMGSLRSARLDLFNGGRLVGAASIARIADTARSSAACTPWPAAQLSPPDASGQLAPWSVALLHGHGTAIALDSIESLSRADSARLVIEIARLASTLPGDTTTDFRGLPFVVRSVRRLQPAPSTAAVIADVVRKVNQEANPRQEQLFLIAERDSTAPGTPLRVAYVERTSGLEEALETTDVVGAIALGAARRPTLVMSREGSEGTSFALVERVAPGRWQLRWSSAAGGC